MRIAAVLGSVMLVVWAATTPVRADLVVVKVPSTELTFILQGKTLTSRTLPTINFTNAAKLTFDLPQSKETEVIVMPPLNQIASKKLVKAKGDEAALRQVAAWALEHGLLVEFHRAIDQLAAANAAEPFAVEAKRLKADLAKPLPDETPEDIKSVSAADYKTIKSAHFLLGCPENDKPVEKTEIKKKKPDARLEQLEHLLEIYVMKCAERGLPVQVPTSRLKVMLSSGAAPATAVPGMRTNPVDPRILWSQGSNILYISQTNNPTSSLDSLKKLQTTVQKVYNSPRPKRNPNGQPGGGNAGGGAGAGGGAATQVMIGGNDISAMSLGNLSKLITMAQSLMAIGTENYELESVSREAAYLFTANCGTVPSQSPSWVRDGLAAYFEFPAETGWLKIGDLGHVRNAWYQASLQDPDRFTITDVVTGRCHNSNASFTESMRASTLSWAAMHFLLQTNPEGLSKYISNFRSMPPDLVLDPDVLNSLFDESFGEERPKLEEAWREHMTGLKAEYLILKDEEGGATTTEN
ncbi:MAG: hypothetical protein JWN70_1144 [Planctomycetaceae bacterium]|nr:hypothetical protein [Planctomycetaceae bacterium]